MHKRCARCTQSENRPLVSVLMGVYYRREDTGLLQRSIQSILDQSYVHFEFHICDDGSTEKAKDVIDCLAQKDYRLRLVRPGDKITLAEKLNACFNNAEGELIARMDDDDYSHPDRFEKQVTWLQTHPEITFAGSNVSLECGGEIVGIRKLPKYPKVKDFLFRQPFIHPSLMFRQEALAAIGGYSESRDCILCEDYDLLLRLYESGYQGANLQQCLLDYNVGEKEGRRMPHRWNETVVRYRHFKKLKLLPKAYPYVIKPLLVGIIPKNILKQLKKRFVNELPQKRKNI